MLIWHADQIVTVIGTNLFVPIAHLLDHMLSRPLLRSDRVSSNYHEGGYAASIILLLAAAVESMVARDRYFNKKALGKQGLSVPEYMKKVHRFRGYHRLSELFVLRDAIAHSHCWVLDYLWSEGKRRKLTSATRVTWSGNHRLEERLNPKTFRTKLLRANVIPDRMDRKDVYAAFATALLVLDFLAKRGANPVTVTNSVVGFRRQRVQFSALLQEVANALLQRVRKRTLASVASLPCSRRSTRTLEVINVACLPNPGKCEWAELKHFIAYYNESRSSDFRHDCCLDLSGSKKSPEILCQSTHHGSLVVERKTLIWPLDYVQKHKAEHFFWDALVSELRIHCKDAPYSLSVASPNTFAERRLTQIATRLSDQIKAGMGDMRVGESIELADPCPAIFRRQYELDRDFDEPSKGLVICSSEPPHEELREPASCPSEFVEKIKQYFEACDKKFSSYQSSTRLLLLNFVSYQVFEQCNLHWWQVFFRSHVPADSILQVWSSFEYETDNWGFENLYERNDL